LNDSGLLDDADIVSSVSGGSYAAYFLYSRWLDAAYQPQVVSVDSRLWFQDCIPSVYIPRFRLPKHQWQEKFCGEVLDPSDSDNGAYAMEKFLQRAPYQAHVWFYQDLLRPTGNLRQVGSISESVSSYSTLAGPAALSVLSLPLHYFGSIGLSMPINTSPSRAAYRAGIERAYGHTAKSWIGRSLCKAGVCAEEPKEGTFAQQLNSRTYQMADLAPLFQEGVSCTSRDRCKPPLWIASASANSGRDLTSFLKTPAADALRNSFEMTPFGQGSGLYGFITLPVDAPLKTVVGSSAAFFDREQRAFHSGATRLAVGAGISLLNLEWGSDIPNFNVPAWRQDLAFSTPVPLYHVPARAQRFSPYIHLSDGGNVDNLGVLAALRRGARNVIVVASTSDGSGTMDSLCRAKNHLALDGIYRLEFDQLDGLDELCFSQIDEREIIAWGRSRIEDIVCGEVHQRSSRLCNGSVWRGVYAGNEIHGYDPWRWPLPILSGTLRRVKDAYQTEPLSRLYLIKPAFHLPTALRQLENSKNELSKRLCNVPYSEAQIDLSEKPTALPLTALAFTVANSCESLDGGPDLKPHGTFPQHNLIKMTLDSSYTLFAAYFDLARHVTRQLQWRKDVGCERPKALEQRRDNCLLAPVGFKDDVTGHPSTHIKRQPSAQ
jgi:hypothetical protein